MFQDGEGSMTAIVTTNAGKPSMKKLIEEEMFSEQDLKKENINAEVETKLNKSGHEGNIKTENKRTKKTRKKSRDMDNHDLSAAKNLDSECSINQNLEKQSVDNIVIDGMMEEFCHWVHQKSLNYLKHDQDDEVQAQSNQTHCDFDRLNEAIKEFKAKHLKENGKIHRTKELIGAREILSSHEELFLKLIQDPNSLLAKYVLNLQDGLVEKGKEPKSLPESNLPEVELGSLRQSEELVNCKQQRNFFRRKVKSQQRKPSKLNENSEAPNRIVILKPGPAGLQNSETENSIGSSREPHYMVGDKGSTERVGTHFFLAEIKRKLKSAMGKEWHGISTISVSNNIPHKLQSLGDRDTGIDKEDTGEISPSKDQFYMERTGSPAIGAKKGDKTGKLKDSEIGMEHETDGYSKQMVSTIYTEAKKHLSEMLSNGDEGVDFSSKQVPKTLGRILSLPEYNLSPIASPGRAWEDKFVTAQMRFSACGKIQKVNSNTWSPKRENNVSHLGRATENLESRSSISDCPDKKVQALNSNPDILENLESRSSISDCPDNKVQALNSNPDISDDHDNGVEGTFVSISDEISPDGIIFSIVQSFVISIDIFS
jgi:hypothetical protein